MRYDQDDPYWKDEAFSGTVAEVTVPVSSITGWYDIFLADQLRDFQALVAAGRPPRLTIGPWGHADPAGMAAAIWEVVGSAVRSRAASSRRPGTGAAVRDGHKAVAGLRPVAAGGLPAAALAPALRRGAGAGCQPGLAADTFTYDPNDPTPSLGGPKLDGNGPGPKDNRPLEKRPTY